MDWQLTTPQVIQIPCIIVSIPIRHRPTISVSHPELHPLIPTREGEEKPVILKAMSSLHKDRPRWREGYFHRSFRNGERNNYQIDGQKDLPGIQLEDGEEEAERARKRKRISLSDDSSWRLVTLPSRRLSNRIISPRTTHWRQWNEHLLWL
jgi:hypothetical protein